MKRIEKKFNAKRIAVYAKRRGASKTFLGLYVVPLTIGCAFGTAALIGTSIFSGYGYFNQSKIIQYLRSFIDSRASFDEKYGEFKTNVKNAIDKQYRNPVSGRSVSLGDVDKIMEIIWGQFYKAFKFVLPDQTNSKVYGHMTTLVNNVIDDKFGNRIGIELDRIDFYSGVKEYANSVLYNLYGNPLSGKAGNYTKTEAWLIVFSVSTAIVGLMILSVIAYWISRAVERSKASEDVKALRKILEVADNEEVEYIISKINRRYSFN